MAIPPKKLNYPLITAVIGGSSLIVASFQILPNEHAQMAGEWNVKVLVQKATKREYPGLELLWTLHLTQDDGHVTGKGEKISINSKSLDFTSRTTMDIEGDVNGNDFILRYVERGKLRETNGTFRGTVKDGALKGTFSQTASDSSGEIFGLRNE